MRVDSVGQIEQRADVAPEPIDATPEAVSFEEFYAAEYSAVVRVAFALTGRLGVAEELSQEAFLAAFRRWDRIACYDDPGAWVRRVVTHRCVSFWRRGLTELRMLARLGRERSATVVIPESDESLIAAIRRLPVRQREVIVLVLLEDRAIDEVAGILGCATETVRTHLRRGRVALAESLPRPEDT